MWIPAPEFNTVKAKSPQMFDKTTWVLTNKWVGQKCMLKKKYTKVWQKYLNHIHKHTNINITNTLQTSNDKWNIKGRHKVDRCIWDNRLSYLVCLDLQPRDFWTSSRSYTSNGTIFAELRLKHLREKNRARKTGKPEDAINAIKEHESMTTRIAWNGTISVTSHKLCHSA